MSRWLLNNVPTVGLVVLFVGVFVSFAVVGTLLVRKWFPSVASRVDNSLVDTHVAVVRTVYGIMLAFMVGTIWVEYRQAEQTVTTEATQVSQLYRDTRGLPAETAGRVVDGIGVYVRRVVDHEWDEMRHGRNDPEAGAAIDNLYRVLHQTEPETAAQRTFFSAAVGKISAVDTARRDRLQKAARALPVVLQILLVGGGFVTVGFLFLMGASNPRTHMLIMVVVATVVAFLLLLVLLFGHPFSGEVSVSPEPFRTGALAHFFEPR